MSKIKAYGQYFTKNKELKKIMLEFIKNKPKKILEPSIGRGDLVDYVKSKFPDVSFDMFEIDKSIKLIETIDIKSVIYEDFLKKNITRKYTTIIGNPPYVKTSNGNLYLDFIIKCYNLLKNNGELIFIVPSDFLKLTSAVKILNIMLKNGTFTDIYHPHKENLFENAKIDIIIFRYCKNNCLEKKVLYNNELYYINNSNGLITFTQNKNKGILVKDIFDVYVGLVSGKENIFKNNELGNINVLTGYNKIYKYIFVDDFPTNNEKINQYFITNKNFLLERKIRKFNEKNWFEWGAPRNIKIMKNNCGKECIYLYNLTRKKNIAFIDKVQFFGGNLIMLLPKKNIKLNNILKFINGNEFKKNFIFSGRFKIGHRQISNSYIPLDYL